MAGRRRKAQSKPAPTSTVAKGRLVEEIVALMHEWPGVQVQRNVRLRTIGRSRRHREIDVLLTTNIAGGYPAHIAFECKNEAAPIGSPTIDEFIGKLRDVGIPSQYGIFVSASGYNSKAIERAREEGIRTLTLKDMTADVIHGAVTQAFQSVVYLLLEHGAVCTNVNPNMLGPNFNVMDLCVLYDEQDNVRGVLPDLLLQAWLDEQIPATIGEHTVQVPLPQGLHYVVSGQVVPAILLGAQCRVTGLVITVAGTVTRHALLNAAENDTVERQHVRATFNPAGRQPVTTVRTEVELEAFPSETPGIHVVIGRQRLPRIRFESTFWPPSQRVADLVMERMRAFEEGLAPDPRPFDIADLEGKNLAVLWEPIWRKHPAAHEE